MIDFSWKQKDAFQRFLAKQVGPDKGAHQPLTDGDPGAMSDFYQTSSDKRLNLVVCNGICQFMPDPCDCG